MREPLPHPTTIGQAPPDSMWIAEAILAYSADQHPPESRTAPDRCYRLRVTGIQETGVASGVSAGSSRNERIRN